MLILLLACAPEPDPCDAMCAAGAALYGGCLEDWGLSWSNAGYESEEDFLGSCSTWAMEARAIAREEGDPDEVDRVCAEREALFSAESATCEDFTSTDWDEVPS